MFEFVFKHLAGQVFELANSAFRQVFDFKQSMIRPRCGALPAICAGAALLPLLELLNVRLEA